MTEEELAEKVARAMANTNQFSIDKSPISETWIEVAPNIKAAYFEEARAAIAAMREAGWKSEEEVDDIVWNERISAQEAYER